MIDCEFNVGLGLGLAIGLPKNSIVFFVAFGLQMFDVLYCTACCGVRFPFCKLKG